MQGSIKSNLGTLNEALSEYLLIHDAIFSQNIGKTPNYQTLKEDLIRIIEDVKDMESSLKIGFQLMQRLNRSSKEIKEIDLVLNYTSSLLEAQNSLLVVITKLHEKSKGEVYNYFSYVRDVNKYKRSRKKYGALGRRLNLLMRSY